MNKAQYINDLKIRLKRLPEEEITNAIVFYEEYFEEAGVENEQTVMNELGSSADLAGKIISEFALKETATSAGIAAINEINNKASENAVKEKKRMSTLWIVILAILASPIALPLAIAFLAIIFALLIVIASVLFSFGITAVALIASGIALIPLGIAVSLQGFASTLIVIGMGLICISVGLIFLMLTIFLSKLSYSILVKLVASFLRKKSDNNEK